MIPIKNIAFVFVFFITIFSCRHADKTDYIFPRNYSGWAAVVFNCDNGVDPQRSEDRIQFPIPTNGILLTSFERSKGILHDKYFILDEQNNKIEFFDSSTKEVPNDSSIYLRGKLLATQYIEGEDLNKNFKIIYLNIGSRKSETVKEAHFQLFEKKVIEFLKANRTIPNN